MNERRYWTIAIIIIVSVFGMTYWYVVNDTYEKEYPDPTMTVEGQFDRVEIWDFHYGNVNGMPVVDERLAIATENGTVPIGQTHYEGSYDNYKNFGFRLLVFNGVEKLNDTLYVMGRTNSTFIYPTLTVTISLTVDIVIESNGIGKSIFIGLMVLPLPLTIVWEVRPKEKDGYEY